MRIKFLYSLLLNYRLGLTIFFSFEKDKYSGDQLKNKNTWGKNRIFKRKKNAKQHFTIRLMVNFILSKCILFFRGRKYLSHCKVEQIL